MKLIDADVLRWAIREDALKNVPLWVYQTIDKQPTAYDVDKVVERLEKKIQTHKRVAEYERKNGTITEEFQQRKAVEVLESAIEIVKAGIDIENNHDKEVYLTALEDYHRLISEECKFMLIKCNPYALHLKEYNDKVLEQLKVGGNY